MKNNILLTFFCIALLTCLFMGNSGGRATDARRGNTGAPGDEAQTCAGCHNSGDYQVTMKIELFDANNILVDAYEPEKTYLAKATILASGANVPKAYGVQMLSLIDKLGTNTNMDANGWVAKTESSNTRIATANNRSYAEQKAPSVSNTFSLSWKAPAKGTGNVTFYAAGNGVDGAGSSDRDNGTSTKLVLKEKITTATNELHLNTLQATLLQNPISGLLRIQIIAEKSENIQLEIIDLQGKTWQTQRFFAFSGENKMNIPTNELINGLYFLKVMDGKTNIIIKFLKVQ
jgi:Secretion system C-terminal sorting domain